MTTSSNTLNGMLWAQCMAKWLEVFSLSQLQNKDEILVQKVFYDHRNSSFLTLLVWTWGVSRWWYPT